MHPFPFFEMIGVGYFFAAAILIVALIVCIAITVITSRASNKMIKKMDAETENEITVSDSVTNNLTDKENEDA